MFARLATLGLFLLIAAPAVADEHARCTIRVIHALRDGHGFDSKITRLRTYLEKEPFTGFRHFRLLDARDVDVKPNIPDTFTLPNGKIASLTYVEHLEGQGGKHRVRLRLDIEDPTHNKKMLSTTFVLDEGGVVLHAGQKHGAGLLVMGISCEAVE
jgi:hypothetical protein